jgi:hypothetical protein
MEHIDVLKILSIKNAVFDLICYFPDQDGAIEHLRNLMEKETGVSDIPLEWYEKSDEQFLDLLLPEQKDIAVPGYYVSLALPQNNSYERHYNLPKGWINLPKGWNKFQKY